MARTMERAIAPASRSVLGKLDPWLKRLGKSPLMLIMAAVGVVAFHAAFARSRGAGLRSEVVLTAAIGFLYFKEPATAMKLVCIGLIVIGVMGLHATSRATA